MRFRIIPETLKRLTKKPSSMVLWQQLTIVNSEKLMMLEFHSVSMLCTKEVFPYQMKDLHTEDQTDPKLLSKESSEMILAKRLAWFFNRGILNWKIISIKQAQETKLTSDTPMLRFKPMNSLKLKTTSTSLEEKEKNTS